MDFRFESLPENFPEVQVLLQSKYISGDEIVCTRRGEARIFAGRFLKMRLRNVRMILVF